MTHDAMRQFPLEDLAELLTEAYMDGARAAFRVTDSAVTSAAMDRLRADTLAYYTSLIRCEVVMNMNNIGEGVRGNDQI